MYECAYAHVGGEVGETYNSSPNRNPLRASPNRKRDVLNICAEDVFA